MRFLRTCSAVISALILSASCSRQQQPENDYQDSWHELLPADSDIILYADMNELNKTAQSQAGEDRAAIISGRLSAEAGLSREDVSAIAASADLDNLPDPASLASRPQAERQDGSIIPAAAHADLLSTTGTTLLIMLKKQVSWIQVRKAASIIFESIPGSSIIFDENTGTLIIRQPSSSVPLYISISDSQKILILKTGPDKPPAAESAAGSLIREIRASSAPIRVAMLASSRMKEKIRQRIQQPETAGSDPYSQILTSLMRSFGNFQGATMAVFPGTDTVQVTALIDLGSNEDAGNAESIINAVLVPVISLAISQYANEGHAGLEHDMKTGVSGSKVSIEMHIRTAGHTGAANEPSGT